MKQLNLWSLLPDELPVIKNDIVWKLFIDGASKKNPGPAGLGFVIIRNEELVCKQGFYLGVKTNNQAEYYGLLIGLIFVKKYIPLQESLHIVSDSLLLVKQMQGVYKVKDPYLSQCKHIALQLLKPYRYTFEHVLRQYNTKADEMANLGVEKKIVIPQDILAILESYGLRI